MESNPKASWKKTMGKQPTVAELRKRIADLEERVHREKLAEETLREQEMRYRAIVDQATSDALLVHDFQGRFLEVNRRACESLGYSKEELLRMSVTDIELDFDLKSAQAEWSKIEPGVPFTLYGHQKRKDGSVFPVEIHFGCSVWNGEKLFLGLVRDITERRMAEEALRESEERFRSIVEGAPDAIFIQSDRRFAYVNPAACRLFGAASADALIGSPVFDRIHPRYHRLAGERMRLLNEERRSLRERVELRFLRMDMSEVWVETSGEPIFYQGKHGALGFARDITWRKQAEEALRESEERFRSIFRDNLSAMFLLDPATGRFLDVNSACGNFYGRSREDLLTMHIQDIGLHGGEALGEMHATASGTQNRFESRHRLADGSVRDVEVFTSTICTYGACVLYCIVNDISEKRSAQRQVRLLGRAVEQNSESIIITDHRGAIEYVNPAFTRSTGYAPDEVAGRNPRMLKSGAQGEAFYRNLWRTILSGETWRGEMHNRRKNGELFWEDVAISPIFDDTGSISHFIAIKEDITERKRLMESLVQAKEKAEESDRLKTAFLQNISHEIRTPMNGILGFLKLLEMPALDDDERSEYIRIVNQSGQRLLGTINDIIELSRIEAGRTDVRMETVDVEQIMLFHYAFFKPQAEEKGLVLSLEKHLRGEEALLRTDKKKLDSILISLLGNALKFTGKGGVEFGNRIEGSELHFYVRDSGAGIPGDRIEVIFERFMQADSSIARPYEGCGLGLTIAKANVESLGGRIRVNSEPGKGSTFSFSIPYLPVSPDTFFSEAPGTDEIEEGPLILIAEDDPISFRLMESVLKKAGYSLLHAVDGEEALRAASEHPGLALVLMDLKMPRMNGFEATRRIRRINKDIPIIAQSAYAFPDDRHKALEAGCDDYLVKPVDRASLLMTVRRYCGEKGGGKEDAGERRT